MCQTPSIVKILLPQILSQDGILEINSFGYHFIIVGSEARFPIVWIGLEHPATPEYVYFLFGVQMDRGNSIPVGCHSTRTTHGSAVILNAKTGFR